MIKLSGFHMTSFRSHRVDEEALGATVGPEVSGVFSRCHHILALLSSALGLMGEGMFQPGIIAAQQKL